MNEEQQLAKNTLLRAREELIREIARSGASGGSAKAGIFAPQLVSIQGAIDILDSFDGAVKDENKAFGEKMRLAREAKKNASGKE
jgi:hypothetical protein